MADYQLTDDQARAAECTGCSVAVSAAAGSGKTSVLAERCAHLVCDAPAPARCDIDQLLVVTFTDAAAAEMRSRIRETLRQRHADRPGDSRLRFQILKLEHAHISTIHSFCRWLLRQHFTRLDLDPNAAVMDADEAGLLLDESVTRVFQSRLTSNDAKASGLRRLIHHYAGGREETIADQLVRIHHFVRTLHDGTKWLDDSMKRLTQDEDQIRELERPALLAELRRQIESADAAIAYIEQSLPSWTVYAELIERHVECLRDWQRRLAEDPHAYEQVVEDLREHKIKTIRPRIPDDADETEVQRKDRAHKKVKEVRTWLQRRLQERFALFSTAQWREGLERLRPYGQTLVELAVELDVDYTAAKKQRHVLDFSDLEQFAYRLLADEKGKPTDVARAIQQKFVHVLVDEYQDINPIQDAILRLASREQNEELPNNLFCVGDVKQSIYRFRIASPEIFLRRLAHHRQPANNDKRFLLPENFRSGSKIIDAVNCTFERLMTASLAGVDYDKDAVLRFGKRSESAAHAVEVHFIEQAAKSGDALEDEQQGIEIQDWVDVERQAYLIGRRIQELVSSGEAGYQDIAILLRAATTRAEQMAGILQDMGIPNRADATTGFFAATEISDMLALLSVLDNAQQDIPLAAVMRSGVCGIRFDESDLLSIKRARTDREFHACVAEFTSLGSSTELGARVNELLTLLARFRVRVRRAPLPEVLNEIYSETGYLSYVAGRPGGAQRLANLHSLHRRARQFSRFGGSASLQGFLRFIERLRRRGDDLGPGAAEETRDAVRIMTIHNSKGLEFPVVFVANLEKRFNLSDASGGITFDRNEFIGLPVAEPERRIRYPSWADTRVKERIVRQSLAEELRILYVALTRAKERLILVGSKPLDDLNQERDQWQQSRGVIPEMHLLSAGNYLDWLVPAMASLPDGKVQWIDDPDDPPQQEKVLHIHRHPALDTSGLSGQRDKQDQARRQACAALEPLPPTAPASVPDQHVDAVFDRLNFVYPSLALGSVPSVMNVSDFKRRVNVWTEEDDLRAAPSAKFAKCPTPSFIDDSDTVDPARIGTATHLFLQHLDYARPSRLAEQLADMVSRGWLDGSEAEHIDLDAIAWFLETELGGRAVQNAARLRREVPFITRIPADEVDPHAEPTDPRDFVILRGMIDLGIPADDGFEVVDFKTDRIGADQVTRRLPIYQQQVRHYAVALAGIWRCPIDSGAVVFLAPRVIELVQKMSSAGHE